MTEQMISEPTSWLPTDWRHPMNALLPTGHHLRPIGPHDASMAMEAVRVSRARLVEIYGKVRAWPHDAMSHLRDQDVARHESAIAPALTSFNYALFDLDETELIGCVYIDPPEKPGADADISWWVRDEYVGMVVERALDEWVPSWIKSCWPLRAPRFVGRDLTWEQWAAIPSAGA